MASYFDYQALLESRRGHNYAYLTDEIYKDLQAKGYKEELETYSEVTAQDKVLELRKTGHFARIICEANRLRIRKYIVYARLKRESQP